VRYARRPAAGKELLALSALVSLGCASCALESVRFYDPLPAVPRLTARSDILAFLCHANQRHWYLRRVLESDWATPQQRAAAQREVSILVTEHVVDRLIREAMGDVALRDRVIRFFHLTKNDPALDRLAGMDERCAAEIKAFRNAFSRCWDALSWLEPETLRFDRAVSCVPISVDSRVHTLRQTPSRAKAKFEQDIQDRVEQLSRGKAVVADVDDLPFTYRDTYRPDQVWLDKEKTGAQGAVSLAPVAAFGRSGLTDDLSVDGPGAFAIRGGWRIHDTSWNPFPDVVEFYGAVSGARLVQDNTGDRAQYFAVDGGITTYGYLSERARLFWFAGTGPSLLFYSMDSDRGMFGVGWSGRVGLEWRFWRGLGLELGGEVHGWIGGDDGSLEKAGAAAAWLGVTASF